MNKRNIFVLLILSICFLISFSLINNNKKYLIINNEKVFEVTNNNIKEVDEYPFFINNSKITYYNKNGEYQGYINFRENKKSGYNHEDFRNKVNIYTSDYKKINSSSLIATYNLKKFKYLDLDNISVNNLISDVDIEVITSYLKTKSITFENNLKYFYKVKLDIDNDGNKEDIYSISNFFSEKDQNDIVNGLEKNPLLYEYVFIKKDNEFNTLYENNYQESKKLEYIMLNNAFDIEGDGQIEFSFVLKDYLDYNVNCEIIYKYMDNKYIKYSDCLKGDE